MPFFPCLSEKKKYLFIVGFLRENGAKIFRCTHGPKVLNYLLLVNFYSDSLGVFVLVFMGKNAVAIKLMMQIFTKNPFSISLCYCLSNLSKIGTVLSLISILMSCII